MLQILTQTWIYHSGQHQNICTLLQQCLDYLLSHLRALMFTWTVAVMLMSEVSIVRSVKRVIKFSRYRSINLSLWSVYCKLSGSQNKPSIVKLYLLFLLVSRALLNLIPPSQQLKTFQKVIPNVWPSFSVSAFALNFIRTTFFRNSKHLIQVCSSKELYILAEMKTFAKEPELENFWES